MWRRSELEKTKKKKKDSQSTLTWILLLTAGGTPLEAMQR